MLQPKRVSLCLLRAENSSTIVGKEPLRTSTIVGGEPKSLIPALPLMLDTPPYQQAAHSNRSRIRSNMAVISPFLRPTQYKEAEDAPQTMDNAEVTSKVKTIT